ncbi:ATP-dependent endonuclease [Neisseria sicca]|uniref:ATP-dependent endonuclease n=3 Tax=Neisseria TaxID=482 RepID=A0A2I1XAQ9_NEISI|nr:ATP-dependent endonuclease [Neisseria sicca]
MHIKNIGCIGNDGLTVELDDIVCLVGANNAGKTTVLRAYELAVQQEKLDIKDFNCNANGKPATVELWVHIPKSAGNIDEKWKEETDDGLLLVRSKWEWPIEGGKPIRSTWDPEIQNYADDGKAAGLDTVFNSRLPKPFRIGSLDNPEEEHKKLLNLVLEPIINKYKEIIENEESDLSKKIKELEILANNPISELRNDIDKIQKQINSSYCKIFSSSGIHLNIGIGDIGFDPAKSLLSGSRIDISETGNSARWDQQGTGSQRALFWSILQVRSELSRASDIKKELQKLEKELQKLESKEKQSQKDKEKIQNIRDQLSQNASSDFFLPGYMLLIDEPETGLHPSAVRAAKEHLYNLASEAGWQVMLSTHHPAFVDPIKDHTTIVRLHRLDKHLEPNIYKSETINFSDDELANLKALMVFDSNVSEIFFGDKVVIVEGDTEFAAFHEIMNSNLEDYPVSQRPLIIRARGKATITILVKILSHFKIDFSVLHDIDSPKISSGGKANSAYSINKTISDTVTEARKAGLNVTYRCSCPNFEIHHQMDLPSKDKPFRSWKAVQEQENVRSSIESILKELISECNDIPSNDGTNYEDTLKNWIDLNHKQDEPCYKF